MAWRVLQSTRPGNRWLRGGLRMMVFLVVAALAEACRRQLGLSLQRFGPAGDILAALMITLWAYEAHARYSFRDRRSRQWPEGCLRFLAATCACLAAQAAALRLAPLAANPIWLFATLLSFAFAHDRIWEVETPSTRPRTA